MTVKKGQRETRPRAHELKTESEREFMRMLPSSWVVRLQNDDDYGIDADVEIFRDGEPTGSLFKVQLKGSDGRAKKRTRSIRIKTLAYWMSFDVPVLVVYYEAATKSLFGVWAHAHHSHVNSARVTKTTTFHFLDESRLNSSSLCDIERAVEQVREIRQGRVVKPLTYAVEFEPLAKFDETAMRFALRQLARRSEVTLEPKNTKDAFFRVKVSKGTLIVAAPVDLASITVHVPIPSYSAQTTPVFAADAISCFAFLLAQLGATNDAADLFLLAGQSSSLIRDYEVALVASICFETARRYRESYELGRALYTDEELTSRDAGDFFITTAILNLKAADPPLGGELLELMRRRIELERQQGNRVRAGRSSYNLHKFYNAIGDVDPALQALDQAAEYDRGYLKRAYFFRERGGLHWTIGNYGRASEDYARAIALGGDVAELRPLLIDALLWAGEFASALEEVALWDKPDAPLNRLVAIASIVANLIINVTGVTRQVRRPLTKDEQSAVGSQPRADICMRYLRTIDAMEPRLWWGVIDHIAEEYRVSYLVLLAHTMRMPLAWASATAEALMTTDGHNGLVKQLIDEAYYLYEDEYLQEVDRLSGHLTSQGQEDIAREMLVTVSDTIASLPSRATVPVRRILEL